MRRMAFMRAYSDVRWCVEEYYTTFTQVCPVLKICLYGTDGIGSKMIRE